MFDNAGTDPLELLRFNPSLAEVAGFEEALRERIQLVGRIPDDAFPLIVALERLEGEGTLGLVSTHIPGKRLSVFFDRPGRRGLRPSFVTGVVIQLVRSLSVLQSKGPGITHSALTPDRVVVTAGGRVCIVEHVLGSALRRLNLSASQLWTDFGLATAPDPSGAVRLDTRTDVFQLGVLSLELLMGRRLTRLDIKERLPDLLDQWSGAVARTGQSSDRLRTWLERALQLGHHAYQTAADASADLRDMPSEPTAAAFELLTGEVGTTPPPAPIRPPEPEYEPAHEPAPSTSPVVSAAAARPTAVKVRYSSSWITTALCLLAVFEAGVIAVLVMRQPAVATTATGGAEPRVPVAASEPFSFPVEQLSAVAPPRDPVLDAPPPAITAPAPIELANNQRSGGVQFQTPVELKVLRGDEVLGSTADGPIIMRAGTYQLDLINTALGLRMRRDVTFREGQLARLDITLPMGRVSVNAQPWAEVSIDDRVYGETPLANLSVPVGNHEVVFRHPALGERRQMITVRADSPTRVGATFER